MGHAAVTIKLSITCLTLINSAVWIFDSANAGPSFVASRVRVICFWFLPLTEVGPPLSNILIVVVPNKTLIL